jgi:uncharacterized protein YdhG (YjbR/CyaY superfamily)
MNPTSNRTARNSTLLKRKILEFLKKLFMHSCHSFDKTMNPKQARFKTITAYINAAPKDAQKKLREIRGCIRKAAPGAQEGIKWSMPAFSYHRILVMFGAFKHHIGFYPTRSAVKAFAKDLSTYVTAEGSIQFPLEKPLPLSLIRKITQFRVKGSLELDGKWKT